jgi:hypothetical protein
VHQLFEALSPDRRASLAKDLRGLLQRLDRGNGRGLVVPGEYLELIVERSS